jgi:putative heme-binding domain-containing protein
MRPCLFTLIALVVAGSLAHAQAPLVAPTDARTPADERKAFKLPTGFDAQLVASEPDILKPMQLAFDLKGRLWVTSSQEYPWPAVGRPGKDRLTVLSDFGPDGKARKVVTFADDLNIPIGVLPLPDGQSVLVSSIDPGPADAKGPDGCWIWQLTDTDGDGKADRRRKLFGPFGTRDTHGMVNSFTLMPDGWVYACHGYLNDSRVKGADGHEVVMNSGNTFRFRPDGSRIEVYTRGQVNPFGMCYDKWFNLYTADCHSKPITQLIRGAVYQSFGKPHDGLGFGPDMIRHDHKSTGLCGLAWYEADQFPKDYHGAMFLGNVVNSRINWDKIKLHGSTPEAIEQPDFLVSDDPWFRPVDIKLGPDGALYVCDFYNKIIGHYEVDLKHPGRDRTRGRLWRIVHTGKEAKSPGDFQAMKREELDKLLGHSNLFVRMQATHALINGEEPAEERPDEQAKKVVERTAAESLYDAHKLWVDEAEPVVQRPRRARLAKAKSDAGALTLVHELRLMCAEAEWAADRQRRGERLREAEKLFKVADDGPVGRAAAEWMTVVPRPDNVTDLVADLAGDKGADTHLRHAARIALRETLRDPASWARLKDRNLGEREIRAIADVLPGLATPEAADFLTAHLSTLATDAGRLPGYVEHASRHGDGHKALFKFVATHKPDNLRLSLDLFRAYQRGLQQKGGPRFDERDIAYAEKLATRGLADGDANANQASLDIISGMRLKAPFDAVSEYLARKGRPENQRAAAGATLLSLEPTQGAFRVGRILASSEEPVTLREKAAQALGTAGTREAHAELLLNLEQAPARLQTVIAAALAAKREGAELLLNAIGSGKASGRLLQERLVHARVVESRLPNVNDRIAELTKGLPSPDQKMTELMGQRRRAFARAKADPKLGAAAFKTHCANCHQLGGEGAKVGPQLDGVGVRGLDRLLEDILDPSRNVDQAMRTTVLHTKDGRSVSGLLLREEGAVYVMADAQGKDVRVPKDDVDERRTSLLSPMPANLAEAIKEEEFHHLMAFLLEQRAKGK